MAICGALDILHNIQYPKLGPLELSPQDIYSGMIKDAKDEEKGCTVHDAIEKWVRPEGCVLETSCRYTGNFNQVINNPEDRARFEINLNNDLNIKKENDKLNGKSLERPIVKAPVVAQMVWIEEMCDLKGNEIYSGPKDPEASTPKYPKKLEYHAIIIVGYREEMIGKTRTKYWIIRNSHGEIRGMQESTVPRVMEDC
ncbi:hypothetical protein TSUD_230850 [Trifolium subterraneum]|nr:hypothetical protein TSUD_230850 [Trifolium subterraneum]